MSSLSKNKTFLFSGWICNYACTTFSRRPVTYKKSLNVSLYWGFSKSCDITLALALVRGGSVRVVWSSFSRFWSRWGIVAWVVMFWVRGVHRLLGQTGVLGLWSFWSSCSRPSTEHSAFTSGKGPILNSHSVFVLVFLYHFGRVSRLLESVYVHNFPLAMFVC